MEKILIGTLCGIGFGSINGGPLGYAVDTFRDLAGIKECKRPSYPLRLRKINSKIKKGLTLLLIASAIALTSGIYRLHPNKRENHQSAKVVKITSRHLEHKIHTP